ncbi:hypothetical protein BH11PSE3_BH11PSE3_13820 [soil metagenome]
MSLERAASSHPPVNARSVDGRRLRSARTRQAIIEAYLELLRRSHRMPTAAQIAAVAGCSARSVFERFTDLNALTLATADHAIAEGQAEAVAQGIDADRPTRILSHVATRAMACERWLSLWRILVASQNDLAELRTRVMAARLGNIERMKLMYRAELSTLSEPARDQLLFAMATLVSFESWDQMRNGYDQSIDAAQQIWRSAIDRLLPPTPPVSL